jgi:hypothetical protein
VSLPLRNDIVVFHKERYTISRFAVDGNNYGLILNPSKGQNQFIEIKLEVSLDQDENYFFRHICEDKVNKMLKKYTGCQKKRFYFNNDNTIVLGYLEYETTPAKKLTFNYINAKYKPHGEVLKSNSKAFLSDNDSKSYGHKIVRLTVANYNLQMT